MNRIIATSLIGIFLMSCSSESNKKLNKTASVIEADKNLTCKQLLFKINDLEYYRQISLNKKVKYKAKKKKHVNKLQMRIDHLDRLYVINDCEREKELEFIQKARMIKGNSAVDTVNNYYNQHNDNKFKRNSSYPKHDYYTNDDIKHDIMFY